MSVVPSLGKESSIVDGPLGASTIHAQRADEFLCGLSRLQGRNANSAHNVVLMSRICLTVIFGYNSSHVCRVSYPW